MNQKSKRILIANRTDSAIRIIRACKEMGIETVAVYSKADKDLLHTKIADMAYCVGDSKSKSSYLNAYSILSLATKLEVDAIHPGIGFLAENAEFADLCQESGIKFIGPSADLIRRMGDKISAKSVAKECGLSLIGDDNHVVHNLDDCYEYVKAQGLPVILKAANGGGGRGIRIVRKEEELERAFENSRKEANLYFGQGEIFIEKYYENAKHIEVQILADQHGNVIHLGDRECSVQRNFQKMIEEARCDTLDQEVRYAMYEGAVKICKTIGYEGVGTIEFLLTPDQKFYFMEMNTRLQVEHAITELVTGIDLVKEQIRVALGEKLSYQQSDVKFRGYALECRVIAEHLQAGPMEEGKLLTRFFLPGGFGVRVDTGYTSGERITPYYDAMLCKISCHGKTKTEAIIRMQAVLDEMQIEGVTTNRNKLKRILSDHAFLTGEYSTTSFQEEEVP